MRNKRHTSPADIDAALTGSAIAPGLEALSAWALEIREVSAAEIAPDLAADQIAALAQTVAISNLGGAGYTALKPSRLERVRRRLVFGSLLSGIGAKVFAASVALATATGGVAATGSLPDAVQDPIASVYNSVGFDFPTSHDDDCAEGAATVCEDEGDGDDHNAPAPGNDSEDVKAKNNSGDDDKDDADDEKNDKSDNRDDDDSDDDNDSDERPDNANKGKGNNNKGGNGGGDDDQDDGSDDTDDDQDDDEGEQDGGDEE